MGIEEETKQFLLKIMQSISMLILWMVVHVFFGIYKGYGFFEETPNWQNLVYYAAFLISLAALFFYIRRKWK